MNAVLSVQGASAPVKKKSFFSKFTRLNMLRLARAVIGCCSDDVLPAAGDGRRQQWSGPDGKR